MPRVKRGVISKKHHKKILKISKGYIGRRKNTYKTSKQAIIKALSYSYRDRKLKKRFFKSYWITNINFFLKIYNFKYNFFINCLKKNFLFLNKKSIFLIFLSYFEFIKFINILFFYYYYNFNFYLCYF